MQTSGLFMLLMKSAGQRYIKQGTPGFLQMHREALLPLTAPSREQHPLSLQIRLRLLGLQPHQLDATLERGLPELPLETSAKVHALWNDGSAHGLL